MNRRFGPSTNLIALLILAICFLLIGIDRAATQAAQISPWRLLTLTLYEWAILLSAFSLLAGSANIIWTHFRRIQQGGADWVLSLILLIVLTTVVTAGLLNSMGTASATIEWLFDSVIAPLQATLFALLGVFLVTAAYRYLRIGRPGGGWMLAGAATMLLIQMPLAQSGLISMREMSDSTIITSFEQSLRWILQWPVMGVMRGAILGSALSLLVIAVRFVFGYR